MFWDPWIGGANFKNLALKPPHGSCLLPHNDLTSLVPPTFNIPPLRCCLLPLHFCGGSTCPILNPPTYPDLTPRTARHCCTEPASEIFSPPSIHHKLRLHLDLHVLAEIPRERSGLHSLLSQRSTSNKRMWQPSISATFCSAQALMSASCPPHHCHSCPDWWC